MSDFVDTYNETDDDAIANLDDVFLDTSWITYIHLVKDWKEGEEETDEVSVEKVVIQSIDITDYFQEGSYFFFQDLAERKKALTFAEQCYVPQWSKTLKDDENFKTNTGYGLEKAEKKWIGINPKNINNPSYGYKTEITIEDFYEGCYEYAKSRLRYIADTDLVLGRVLK